MFCVNKVCFIFFGFFVFEYTLQSKRLDFGLDTHFILVKHFTIGIYKCCRDSTKSNFPYTDSIPTTRGHPLEYDILEIYQNSQKVKMQS